MTTTAQIIPIHPSSEKAEKIPGQEDEHHAPWCHTIDLLMEDFGKKHCKELCVLCEPMQILGLHRDAVVVDLAEELFLNFFPSFDAYVLEVRQGLMEKLLDRRAASGYDRWQDKLKELLLNQVASDLSDFITDIEKHLRKFASTELSPERREALFQEAFNRLKKDWLWKQR